LQNSLFLAEINGMIKLIKIPYWKQTNSWRATIRVQRTAIAKLLRQNTALTSRLQEALNESWSGS